MIGAKALQTLVAVTVVSGALLGIAQYAVGLGGLFELLLGLLIVGIAIRMILQRQFTIGALQRRVVTVAAHAQDFVVVAFDGVHFLVTATFTMAGRKRRPRKL